jgi:hypothetical protein
MSSRKRGRRRDLAGLSGPRKQTNLVSSIAAEIELNINRADWDADCYEDCQRLLLRETQRMRTVSDDRGLEEIPVLVELETQQWVDEALRNASRATELILDRVASLDVCRPDQDCGEAGDFDLTNSKAAQTVMRAVTSYPLSDTQLERIVKLALGKRVLVAKSATEGSDPPGATTSVVRTGGSPQTGPEVRSYDGSESHRTDSTEPEGPPSASGTARPVSLSSEGIAAEGCSGVSAARQQSDDPPSEATNTSPAGKKRSRATKRAARATAAAGNESVREKPRQCLVFGCTRGHDPGDCPTFLDMTPKERLDLIHAKQLCLLCLRHPLSVGCEVAGKGLCCPAEGCDRPHHATLHGVLKAGGPSPPGGKTDPPGGPAISVDCRTPETARQLRGLLESLGIDSNTLEVRIGVRQPGESGWPHGGSIKDPGETKAGTARMAGRLMEALTSSLCQAGERFVDSAAVSSRRMARAGDPGEIQAQRPQMIQSESTTSGTDRTRVDGTPGTRWTGGRGRHRSDRREAPSPRG